MRSCDKSVLRNPSFWGNGHTVVHTFGDRLEHFDIEGGSTTIVPIVLVLVVADDAFRSFGSSKLNSGRLGYPGNDLTGIERENGRVRIDRVRVKYLRKCHGFQDGFGDILSEWVFIRTANSTTRISKPTRMLRMINSRPKNCSPGIPPRLR
jgi:hypothetical protein